MLPVSRFQSYSSQDEIIYQLDLPSYIAQYFMIATAAATLAQRAWGINSKQIIHGTNYQC